MFLNAALVSVDKMKKFEAGNIDAAVAASRLSNDEIQYFSKKIRGDLNHNWYKEILTHLLIYFLSRTESLVSENSK